MAMKLGERKEKREKRKKEDDDTLLSLLYVTSTLPVIHGCIVHT